MTPPRNGRYIAWNVVIAVVLDKFSCIYSLEPDPLLGAMQAAISAPTLRYLCL